MNEICERLMPEAAMGIPAWPIAGKCERPEKLGSTFVNDNIRLSRAI